MASEKRILVFVGPSGSGKTTVGNELSKRGIKKLVTTTTRPPREGEVDGQDYYFAKAEELDPEDFVEQTVYNDNTYGLTRKEVETALEEYDIVHVSLDQNGAIAMRKAYPEETRIIFFEISEAKMAERMRKRGESEETIAKRLAFGRETQENIPPNGTDLIVQNIHVEDTAETILKAFGLEEHTKNM